MKISFLLALTLLLAGDALARDRFDQFKAENDRDEFDYEGEERVWKEQKSNVPPVSLDALKPMNIDHGPQGIVFYLDQNSIAMNKQDRVTRYWLAAKSGNKIVSLNFEAIRCSTKEYKQIAYASPNRPESIREIKSASWRKIRGVELNDHHTEIAEAYICAGSTPKTAAAVISSLKGDHNPYAEITDL